MIYGIGNDITRVDRMQLALQRSGPRFAEKILGAQEWQIYQQRAAQSELRAMHYLATRFAAKEAFGKAIGTGVRLPMTLKNLQTLNDAQGKPVLHYSDTLASWMQTQRLKAHVSLSDEKDYALAFVVVEAEC
ncbi:holo-ACP synthase [Undibacterium curvum]|uniref:Holo-[acyl-carrier-protein] synthase n=1 Tax=Undibacterium curvum TaxID=2762294 RepID=A0ABR7A7P4_9BURK|nr:holo-ACP synthase [Undibacterium curvum]MBC3932871.1 holo-ACP synthase [Undibacterium curvum]